MRFRIAMKAGDGVGQILHSEAVEPAGIRQAREQRVLLEALHLDQPVHRRAAAAQLQTSPSPRTTATTPR